MSNEESRNKNILALLASTGLIGLLATGVMGVAQDASIALDVAAQHGEELLSIRTEIALLRADLVERTQQRYTAAEHAAYDRYIEQRLSDIEAQIDRCCARK